MTATKTPQKKAPATDPVLDLLGSAPALSSERGKSGPPDIRDVSLRWFAGTVLTGVTSIILMGGALMAAVDGQITFSVPSLIQDDSQDAQTATANASTAQFAAKTDRPIPPKPEVKEQKILRLSTLSRGADGNHVRTRPFARLNSTLARRNGDEKFNIPSFDPVTIFSGSSKFREKGEDEVLYDSQVDDEIEIRDIPLPIDTAEAQSFRSLSDDEIEADLRKQLPVLRASLNDGTLLARAGAIAYVDPARFEPQTPVAVENPFDTLVVVRSENVSTIQKTSKTSRLKNAGQAKIVSVNANSSLPEFLKEKIGVEDGTEAIIQALSDQLGGASLNKQHSFRMSYAGGPDQNMPDVVSVYENDNHLTTIARADDGNFITSHEPPAYRERLKKAKRPAFSSSQTSTYRSIFETALKHNIPRPLIRELIRIYAFDVDFRRSTRTTDNMEVFYSLDAKSEAATEDSEILFTSLTLDGVKRRYYRFKTDDDGVVDYYDENGRSAKKFLMRQPVPRAKFRSRFGWRRHPILRTRRLHKGVDWSAPRGTPIFAAGNGVIEDAKWFSGYGRWIKIRHANGYKTGYAHMSRFAKGMKPGARVRQGQIIGYVGSTGLSTGPHLHYEVIVNGRHVDPMRIRLPRGRVLSGEQLASFERERDRIDQLFTQPNQSPEQDFALNNAN